LVQYGITRRILRMTVFYQKFDILVVSFPFSSQLKEKARPVLVISNDTFNRSKRQDLLVMAISGSLDNKLLFEPEIEFWKDAGLLKSSIIKAAIATIEQQSVIQKLGTLHIGDQSKLKALLNEIIG
jgi:mRNA-degrading endonuclease toxin of MazEF toxin-antitoxin module